ncbi:nucleoside deaminase [Acetomicrobium sp.]|uniref:nucleoside deaminase n=1 Tax=Acetomicrobium sp. TaxID=1872099 RepID=UPI003D995155
MKHERAFDEGEIPIGAVIVRGEDVIARAHNTKEYLKDPTAHAEINVIKAASVVLSRGEFSQCTLYVTLGTLHNVRGCGAAGKVRKG